MTGKREKISLEASKKLMTGEASVEKGRVFGRVEFEELEELGEEERLVHKWGEILRK